MLTEETFSVSHHRTLWAFMLGACALSVTGSLWAAAIPSECESCQRASELVGGFNLAVLGVAFYTHLMTVLVLKGSPRYIFSCAMLAAGVHLVLMALLLSRRLLCPPCLLTTAGALAMMGLSLAMDRANVRRAAGILLAAMVLTAIVWRPLSALDPKAIVRQRQLRIALAREEMEPPVPAGRVRLLVYSRPTCALCQELDAKVMPIIRRKHHATLDVQYRTPWKGLLSPTLIIRGQRRTSIVGLPTVERLEDAIQFAQGKTGTQPDERAQAMIGGSRASR
jgi:hypothetical protein